MCTFSAGDIYWLYTGICAIPDEIINDPTSAFVYTLVEVSRSVCRSLCSVTYNDYCSSFLYISANRSCVLTPYTGEWLSSNVNSCPTKSPRVLQKTEKAGSVHYFRLTNSF